MRISRATAIITIAVLLVGCSDNLPRESDGNRADAAAKNLCREASGMVASEAWMRSSRAGQPTSAAYLMLANCSGKDDALIAVSFEGAGAVELHASAMSDDGIASMSQTKTAALATGEAISFMPGGGHIMLIGVTEAIIEGDNVVMTLQFENAPALEVAFEVRNAMSADDHGGH